jgi:hypothetical protein
MEHARALFAMYGVDFNADNVTHFGVLMQALQTYDQRSRVYGQAWQQYGALANLLQVARKADRLMAVWWTEEEEYVGKGKASAMHKDALDDALDLLNYCVFFMRLARAGDLTGSTPERPNHPSDPDFSPEKAKRQAERLAALSEEEE